MNQGLRNELAFLSFVTSLGLLAGQKKNLALALGTAAAVLRFLPPFRRYSYENKSVIITGGSRGLGLALAQCLVNENAKVTLLARDSAELDRAREQLLKNPNSQVLVVPCDVTRPEQLRLALHQARSEFGQIDVLINNAGAVSVGPFESMDPADFEAQINLHLQAVIDATRLVVPEFRQQGGGRIINISSIGGKIPVPHMAPYCASKFALSGFSKTVAAELRRDRILVTTAYPGLMRTGSPVQAVFKGDHEKEFAWFAVSDSTPGISMSPFRAAQQILEAARHGQSEVIVSWPAKIGTFVHANFPEIFATSMDVAARFLPEGTSHHRKTGAASSGWLDRQLWGKPFQDRNRQAQEKFNQKEKVDPEFNMNIHKPGTR